MCKEPAWLFALTGYINEHCMDLAPIHCQLPYQRITQNILEMATQMSGPRTLPLNCILECCAAELANLVSPQWTAFAYHVSESTGFSDMVSASYGVFDNDRLLSFFEWRRKVVLEVLRSMTRGSQIPLRVI